MVMQVEKRLVIPRSQQVYVSWVLSTSDAGAHPVNYRPGIFDRPVTSYHPPPPMIVGTEDSQ